MNWNQIIMDLCTNKKKQKEPDSCIFHTINIKKSIMIFKLKNCENTYNSNLRNWDSMVCDFTHGYLDMESLTEMSMERNYIVNQ